MWSSIPQFCNPLTPPFWLFRFTKSISLTPSVGVIVNVGMADEFIEDFNSHLNIETTTWIYSSSSPSSYAEPYFDPMTLSNVTALVGKSAYLNCRVRNLGNKTVSFRNKLFEGFSAQHRDTFMWYSFCLFFPPTSPSDFSSPVLYIDQAPQKQTPYPLSLRDSFEIVQVFLQHSWYIETFSTVVLFSWKFSTQ